MNNRIAIFNWGELSIHTYYLAEQLKESGIEIDLYLYTPLYADKHHHVKTLLQNLKDKKINIIQLKCTYWEAKFIHLNKIFQVLHYPSASLSTNLFLPAKTRKFYKGSNYKNVITISQYALYWLYRTDRLSLNKTIHYSLEIEKISDPGIKKHWNLYSIIRHESKLLKRARGIIIQHPQRLNAFLNMDKMRKDFLIFFLPVSIPGNIIKKRSDYLYRKYNLNPAQKILLYFGTGYSERKLDELVKAYKDIEKDNWILVLHGDRKFPDPEANPNIKISKAFLQFKDVHLIISSATIGIAFYDNGWPNPRLTAFSSEKIARYLQAGVPFIAFKNESYTTLKSEFNCCELLEEISDLKNAIYIIMNNYEAYRNNCFDAYNKYYNIKNSIKPLLHFLVTPYQEK